MIKVAFRFDDPSLTSNHSLENEVIQLSAHHNVRINFAVIPYRKIDNQLQKLTPEKALHLINAYNDNLIEISQHGHAHLNLMSGAEIPSEFTGLNKTETVNKITRGKNLLDSLFSNNPRGFVPPFNSFDNVTLSTINENNFLFLSAGWDYPKIKTISIPLLPRTCHINKLKTAIDQARLFISCHPIIIVVLHHYDFLESAAQNHITDLSDFKRHLAWLKKQQDCQLCSLEDLAKTLPLKKNLQGMLLRNRVNKLHWRLKQGHPDKVFLPISTYHYVAHQLKRNKQSTRSINDA